MARLFIVDDDIPTCEVLHAASDVLFSHVQVYHQATPFLAESFCASDTVLLDLQMPDVDGIETIRHLASSDCKAALILISGYDAGVLCSAEELAREYGLNVLATLTKPVNIAQLQAFLTTHIQVNGAAQWHQQPLIRDEHTFIATEQQILAAIEQKQFTLYYQPQINLQTSQVVGVEALVRWQHPQLGMIYPDAFIDVAERSGIITSLTSYVLDLAVKQSAIWQQQGKSLQISVNVSAQDFANLSMPEKLHTLVEHNQLDPSMLVMELTERALMSEMITSLDILTRLRLKGFRLSIDDFGTGYSSLSQLHRVPFTELKVDKSFVSHVNQDPQSLAIVETCIMLGHKLNMKVVAEGIEDEATKAILTQLNCDCGQGYYFAKPMSVADFDAWYADFCHQAS